MKLLNLFSQRIYYKVVADLFTVVLDQGGVDIHSKAEKELELAPEHVKLSVTFGESSECEVGKWSQEESKEELEVKHVRPELVLGLDLLLALDQEDVREARHNEDCSADHVQLFEAWLLREG